MFVRFVCLSVCRHVFAGGLQQYIAESDKRTIAPEELSVRSPPLINTSTPLIAHSNGLTNLQFPSAVDIQRNRDLIKPWLDNCEPFIVVGPEGCGKTLLLTSMFKLVKGATVSTIHCSAQTNATHVMQKLIESCSSFSTAKGRVLRPREGERLILFLKDLNLAS